MSITMSTMSTTCTTSWLRACQLATLQGGMPTTSCHPATTAPGLQNTPLPPTAKLCWDPKDSLLYAASLPFLFLHSETTPSFLLSKDLKVSIVAGGNDTGLLLVAWLLTSSSSSGCKLTTESGTRTVNLTRCKLTTDWKLKAVSLIPNSHLPLKTPFCNYMQILFERIWKHLFFAFASIQPSILDRLDPTGLI